MSAISLYFHVPFCTKKCPYCHFYIVPNRTGLQQIYFEGLKQDWASSLPLMQDKQIVSVYFGGGTPSLLDLDYLCTIFSWLELLNLSDHCEITLEANPEEIDLLRLKAFRKLGINRLSLGVQSLDDSSLQVLGRSHSAERAKEAVLEAHRAGFENISIDLMYDLPWQNIASWHSTLQALTQLPITHLSLYNLTIEPHTSFFKRKEHLKKAIPNDEESLRLLEMAVTALEQLGLIRYEISAFAKNGFQSRHNTGYWTGRPFLGFGPSAFSYWGGKRFRKFAHLLRYRRALVNGQNPIDFEETLSYPENLHELLAIRLRLLEGVNIKDWALPKKTLVTLGQLQEAGLLENEESQLRLTQRGTLFYDTVAETLI